LRGRLPRGGCLRCDPGIGRQPAPGRYQVLIPDAKGGGLAAALSLALTVRVDQEEPMNPQPAIFLAGFVVILLGFIFFIAKVSGRLSGKISQRRYDLVERVIIAGIFLGIVGMFQPWMHAAYRAGFLVLLF